jgi:DNA-binding MarR family transcriptional regulator
MTVVEDTAANQDSAWPTYQANLPRHLMAVARHLQSALMHALIEQHGHRALKLHFGSFMTLIGPDGARITELAEQLSISKQAVNQTINQIEDAGYVRRQPDPSDGRAKLVVLTAAGEQLLRQGAALVEEVEAEFSALIDASGVERLSANLAALYTSLDLVKPGYGRQGLSLAWLLPRLSDYSMQQLMELTRSRGHPGLKMSYGQVLAFMGPNGGRIQHMASINEVSKQAIAAIANELEEQGYLDREIDPENGRQILLKLSANGMRLLDDSVGSIAELEYQFAQQIGKVALQQIKADILTLYTGLRVESEVFSNGIASPDKLMNLAARLLQQLGTEDARTLAATILNISEIPS